MVFQLESMNNSTYFPYVTPNHFSGADFSPFPGLSLDAEFNLIAPVMIYSQCDCSTARRDKARRALNKLKKMGHPLVGDQSVADLISQTRPIENLDSRYNGLVMAIAEDEIEGVESYIDPHGAYSFRVGQYANVLMGDAYGTFAFHEDSQSLRERLKEAEQEQFETA